MTTHKKLLVTFNDSSDLPRAYAAGPEDMKERLREIAATQLAAYITKKNKLGEGLSRSDFTEKIAIFEDETP